MSSLIIGSNPHFLSIIKSDRAWSEWLDDETEMVRTHAGEQIKLDIDSAQMRTCSRNLMQR